MNSIRVLQRCKRLLLALLLALAAVLLSSCGVDMQDMHDIQTEEGDAVASLTLRVSGDAATPQRVPLTGEALLEASHTPAPPATLPMGGGMTLTGFRLGMNQVALRPTGGGVAASTVDGAHRADLLSDPPGHSMGAMRIPGGRTYQMDLGLWPMTGIDSRDPAGAWAMVLELIYVEPEAGFTHTFVLRWGGPGAFTMRGTAGVAMHGGERNLMLAFRMERVFAASYEDGSLLEALLTTTMDAQGVHVIDATGYPGLAAAVLTALHDAMDFGEDTNRDGHLDGADDRMVGHSASGCSGSMM